MSEAFEKNLLVLDKPENHSFFRLFSHGVERECLRVNANANLSDLPHPEKLGSTLTHPNITTDYSEALLEFITPTFIDLEDGFELLSSIHSFTLKNMPDQESLWMLSMPPMMPSDDKIPVAKYGTSNIGKSKHVYRLGLEQRYGKKMQMIAGIHYNFSVPPQYWLLLHTINNNNFQDIPDYQSAGYFRLIRNFKRFSWLLMYLFGASPAIDNSFLSDGIPPNIDFKPLGSKTHFSPWATSLRMSPLGYINSEMAGHHISYNNKNDYVESLKKVLKYPNPTFQAKGIKHQGKYIQLNANLLQIENEYYSPIRPKCIKAPNEKSLVALEKHCVEYIEVRCLDLDPFTPLGISIEQARFLDVFLIYCSLEESKPFTDETYSIAENNFQKSVAEGRRPGVTLQYGNQVRTLVSWGRELMAEMELVAALMDKAHSTAEYTKSIHLQQTKLDDSSLTPSAMVLNKIKEHDDSFVSMGWDLSKQASGYLREQSLDSVHEAYFNQLTKESIQEQLTIEKKDQISFDTYLRDYINLDRL